MDTGVAVELPDAMGAGIAAPVTTTAGIAVCEALSTEAPT
jgi:hypothetical protein